MRFLLRFQSRWWWSVYRAGCTEGTGTRGRQEVPRRPKRRTLCSCPPPCRWCSETGRSTPCCSHPLESNRVLNWLDIAIQHSIYIYKLTDWLSECARILELKGREIIKHHRCLDLVDNVTGIWLTMSLGTWFTMSLGTWLPASLGLGCHCCWDLVDNVLGTWLPMSLAICCHCRWHLVVIPMVAIAGGFQRSKFPHISWKRSHVTYSKVLREMILPLQNLIFIFGKNSLSYNHMTQQIL